MPLTGGAAAAQTLSPTNRVELDDTDVDQLRYYVPTWAIEYATARIPELRGSTRVGGRPAEAGGRRGDADCLA